jgi:hypothetical protein
MEAVMKIVMQTNADFTPLGKRTARIVQTTGGGRQLRWYVGGKLYHRLAPTDANLALTREWLTAS